MRRSRILLCALLVLLAAGCARSTAPRAEPTQEPAEGAVRLAAVGDSITDADSPDYAAGALGPESWVSHTVGEEVAFVGGWARWGATSAEMAEGAGQVDADLLVVMAGTNDTGTGAPFAETARNITAIVQAIGADDVLLSGVPPIDASPGAAVELNEQLESLAQEQGWHWVDAGAAVRTAEDTFAPGMASDGLHPTERGAARLGEVIGAAVREITG